MIIITKKKYRSVLVFWYLVLVAFIVFARNEEKRIKTEPDNHFSKVIEEMDKFKNEPDEVLKIFYKNCLMEGSKNELKKEFRKSSRQIRIDIYRRIVLAYYDSERLEQVDQYIKKLLAIDYNFNPREYSKAIRDKVNKYVVLPRLLVGLKTGMNFSKPHPLAPYSILESPNLFPKKYNKSFDSPGLELGILFAYTLTKNYSVCIEAYNVDQKFKYNNSLKLTLSGETDTIDLAHIQKLSYIEIPIYLKRYFGRSRSRLKIFLQAGGFINFLYNAYKKVNINVQSTKFEFMDSKNIYIKDQLNHYNGGFYLGGGIGFYLGRERDVKIMEISVSWKKGIRNIVNPSQRFTNEELLFGYYDVFDDIKLDNYEIAFKILLPVSFKVFSR